MSQKIRIENGTSNQTEYTSLERANFFVEGRRAVWISERAIRFLDTDHRHQSAKQSARPRILTDGIGFATLEGLQGTPVIQPIRLLTGKRPLVPPVALRPVVVSSQFYVQRF